ncbi:hypothetical protein KY358_05530 [Candidatus Woesearchaeota archaeon]|nr:hypothetical protein [Candidatus Woesearchaeota archaeon]
MAKGKKISYALFWTLVLVSLIVMVQFFVPAARGLLGGTFFLLPIGIFSLLGLALLIFAIREKPEGKVKLFFILSGAFSFGFLVCILLHNLFYGLGALFDAAVLKSLMEILHAAFFIIAVFVCPLGFLVSMIWGILIIMRGSFKKGRNGLKHGEKKRHKKQG